MLANLKTFWEWYTHIFYQAVYLHDAREDPVFPVLHCAGCSVMVEKLLQPFEQDHQS